VRATGELAGRALSCTDRLLLQSGLNALPEGVLVAEIAAINLVAEQAIELPAGEGSAALRTNGSEAMSLGPQVAAVGFLGLMGPDVERG